MLLGPSPVMPGVTFSLRLYPDMLALTRSSRGRMSSIFCMTALVMRSEPGGKEAMSAAHFCACSRSSAFGAMRLIRPAASARCALQLRPDIAKSYAHFAGIVLIISPKARPGG